jgi:pre-mRNA-splicing factor CWC22
MNLQEQLMPSLSGSAPFATRAQIDKRTQYMVEVLFQIRKDKFKDNPAIPEELDLVEEEDQMTHNVGLTDDLETLDELNVFHLTRNSSKMKLNTSPLKKEILGDESSR